MPGIFPWLTEMPEPIKCCSNYCGREKLILDIYSECCLAYKLSAVHTLPYNDAYHYYEVALGSCTGS